MSGLLRARSFNIESLTVGTTHEPGRSRMTIAIRGDDGHLRQVLAQLERLIDVLEVHRPHQRAADRAGAGARRARSAALDPQRSARLRGRPGLRRRRDRSRPTGRRGELASPPPPTTIDRALEALRGHGLRSLVRAGAVAMAADPTDRHPRHARTERPGHDQAHLRRRYRRVGARRPDRGRHRLRQPGRGACAQPVRVGRQRGRRPAAGLGLGRAGSRGRPARDRCGLARRPRRTWSWCWCRTRPRRRSTTPRSSRTCATARS